MEALYDNLLEYYDEVFPVDSERLDFITGIAGKLRKSKTPWSPRVLDVGCATGGTSLALMRRGMDVTGVDFNAAMIQSACRRNPEPKTNARFFRIDMLDVAEVFAPESFDVGLCLGNTLVHLDGSGQISLFLQSLLEVLQVGGVFIFQVVNYDLVLAQGLTQLPTIQTKRARFVRNYSRTGNGRIVFEASIYSSSDQVVFRDTVTLYPAGVDELTALLKKAGFKKIDFYDDFDGEPFTGSSLGVVGVAFA
jgi:glycine/sarcosine N-methyltransferase